MFSLPNVQIKFPLQVEGFALVPADDFRIEAIKKKQPRLGSFLNDRVRRRRRAEHHYLAQGQA